ncbi:MAG: hypothetical protein QNK37_37670 [Acidobacteriota bacterium]|nr:hypothetical protein [Acidobacteriota bacterium]
MSQIVIYKGITVEPKERDGGKIRVRTSNPADAQKAGLPFKDMEGGAAIFEAWVPEDELVAVD